MDEVILKKNKITVPSNEEQHLIFSDAMSSNNLSICNLH